MNTDLLRLAGEVHALRDRLRNASNRTPSGSPKALDLSRFGLMSMGLIGVCYSLAKAQALPSSTAALKLILGAGDAVLEDLCAGRQPSEQAQADWFAGYWLNDAELRLYAVFEQLLRTALGVYDYTPVHKLVQRCSDTIMAGPDRDQFTSAAQRLMHLGVKVNSWKHDPYPSVDTEPRDHRTLDAVASFEALTLLFGVLLQHGPWGSGNEGAA